MQKLYKYLFLLHILCFSAWASAAQPELLDPEKAFRFSARVLDASNIEVRYQIADGYYLYRERFAFAAEPAGVKLGAARIPEGKHKKDEFFGDVQTHRGEIKIVVPVESVGAAAGGRVTLTATSQGCADVGVCYVPMDSKIQLVMTGGAGATGTGSAPTVRDGGDPLSRILGQAAGGNTKAPAVAPTAGAEDTRIAALFHGEFWLLIASFFGFGLLLSFTPCVLPMIPILSGIIVGRGHPVTRMHGFALSAAYVLDMLQAMNTGHDGSLTTIHANNARDALSRVETMVSMGGMNIATAGLRHYISSALDVIIQLTRLSDGTRKVTGVSEVTGMQGDIISLQEIFSYEQLGLDQAGKVKGQFKATGIRPKCMERLKARGVQLPADVFNPEKVYPC